MNGALEILVSLTVAGSVVVGCLLLVSLLPASFFPAKWRYFLGKVALAFFLVPAALLIHWLFKLYPSKAGTPLIEQQPVSRQLTGFLPDYLSASLALTMLAIWATGGIIYSLWQLYCHRRFTNELHRHSTPVRENSEIRHELLLMKQELGIKDDVQLLYSSAVRSPALFGLRKPIILLPEETSAQLNIRMVFHHELMHVKRKDLAVKSLVLAASALHWFNPFVHLLRKDIHKWSELSCDEEVVKDMSYEERKQYGAMILHVMEGRRLPLSFCTSLSGTGKQLKRRLEMMLNVKKRKKSIIAAAAVTTIVAGAIGTATAVWAATNTPEVKTEISEEEGLHNINIQPPEDSPGEGSFEFKRAVEGTEVIMIPIEEATEEQIRQDKATYEDIDPDSEMWAEIKEDPPAESVSIFEDDIVDVKGQEVIMVEVEKD
ncbi:M56 family metallopeptidase [Alkalihalobacillus oceani]|uniref:M56 family metallopeptidase n=1 Tax=Halalkalibacter oceani TaxID=1653776 RepID=A0A9X2DT93_9BACI|nr:M56 family metallopeptidase [Halalkalibacter oceani]MCM3716664.1 M56 family metallopeptidase [Halalkalibacter oceani]